MATHRYRTILRWTGDRGSGTSSYTAYDRAFSCHAAGKPAIEGSSDPAFRGDPTRWNPEELLVASLSACHQLWYLHLCARAGIVLVSYEDAAVGIMEEEADGGGRFVSITLNPVVGLAPGSDATRAETLHAEAGRLCFVQRTLACRIDCIARVEVGPARADDGRRRDDPP